MIVLLLLACKGKPEVDPELTYPRLMFPADRKEALLERLADDPHAELLARIEATAAGDYLPPAETWDAGVYGTNGEIARAAAFLAWLRDDEAMADKAREGFGHLTTDFDTNTDWDVNIRMARPLMGYADAVDLLRGTPWLPEDERVEMEDKLGSINEQFVAAYVDDDFMRQLVLGPAQNNHPIRTASAIGYVALALPEHPDSARWLDFAASELEYLMGLDGQYLSPDGAVSEGPFYYGFGLSAGLPFLIAMDQVAADRELSRDCRNRQDVEPWAGHGCVDGEPFVFDNPLHDDLIFATVDWWIGIRLPSGECPPLEDSYFNAFNGGAVLTGWRPEGRFRWNWEDNTLDPRETTHGVDLTVHHLAWIDPDAAPVEPDWTTRFFLDGGHAVLRSDWSPDARYLLLTAEAGAARMTLHDHVDATSFQVAAYGEYLLLDPGYYKPSELNNAETSGPEAHNVVLIDGRGAPKKGLLTDFGDTDARLDHTWDGALVDWAEATQSYEDTTIQRATAMLRDRYFVVADRLDTSATEPREHRWRLGGNAGYDAGGAFSLLDDGAIWERERAGIEVRLASTEPLTVAEPALVEGEAPHVHQFDEHRSIGEHGVVDGIATGRAPDFLAVLAPWRVGDTGADGPLRIEREPLDGALAWRVTGADFVDVVLLREAGAPESITLSDGVVIETDGAIAVLGLQGEALWVLVDGSSLVVDGVERAAGSGLVVVE